MGTQWTTPLNVVYGFALLLIPVLLWFSRKLIEEWISERFRSRKSKLLHISSRIWQHSATDFELQFIFSNHSTKHAQLRELVIVRPKASKVAWFAKPMKHFPNTSHLDGDHLSNRHLVTLEAPSGESKTVSMAMRVPTASTQRVKIQAEIYESGHPKPVYLKHEVLLSSALPVFSRKET